MDYLSDSFLFTECRRWDVRGKSYFDYPNKYYCEDIGLRNCADRFPSAGNDAHHENIIFNDLIIREVRPWTLESCTAAKRTRKERPHRWRGRLISLPLLAARKTYIQSAYALGSDEKAQAENKPFALTGDSFPKIIVRHDIHKRWYDDNGVLNIGVIDFLLDDSVV